MVITELGGSIMDILLQQDVPDSIALVCIAIMFFTVIAVFNILEKRW